MRQRPWSARPGRRYRSQAIRQSAARPRRTRLALPWVGPSARLALLWAASSALLALLVVTASLALRTSWPLVVTQPEPTQSTTTVEPDALAEPAPATPVTTPEANVQEVVAAVPVEPSPPEPLPGRWPEVGPAVALTFDAGADRGYAEDILDTLREAGVPASFGVTGRWAEENPDLVRRMATDGHQVINHTLDHRSFTGLSDELGGLSPARRRQELEQAEAILAPLIGHTTRPWYRLPYGDDADGIGTDVASTGFTRKAGWTIDSLGWRGLAAADIVARCLRLAEADAIYVFHVSRTSQDGPALARIIAGVRERGFGFATLERLE